MRIVAGDFKGRRLEAPAGSGTRPTTDRVREGLMSALFSARGAFDGLSVLDAFAGTGALGLEALSRGADHCTFLDTSRKARSVVERNITTVRLERRRYRVLPTDVFNAARKGAIPGAPFDLVFLDPPYAYAADDVRDLVANLALRGSLVDGALCVYEYSSAAIGCDCDRLPESLTLLTVKRYGDTEVAIIRYREGETS